MIDTKFLLKNNFDVLKVNFTHLLKLFSIEITKY